MDDTTKTPSPEREASSPTDTEDLSSETATGPSNRSSPATVGTREKAGSDSEIDPDRLPASYDRLVGVDQLTRGQHNPRSAQPSETLRRSVATDGLVNPLIVWPAAESPEDGASPTYHITDGWQRYQAAVDAGWEQLPVQICDSPLAALGQTATRGEVDPFSTYHWAVLCQNMATELAGSPQAIETEQIHQIAEMANRTPQTVRKYLAVLSLPDILHPLLRDGPAGTDSDWAALSNYNESIRRYGGLRWETAHHLARHTDEFPHTRLLGVAATAVAFETPTDAQAYISLAAEEPEVPLDTLRKRVRFGGHQEETLEIPRTTIELDPDAKQALMEYCRQHRQSLSDIVASRLRQLVTEVTND